MHILGSKGKKAQIVHHRLRAPAFPAHRCIFLADKKKPHSSSRRRRTYRIAAEELGQLRNHRHVRIEPSWCKGVTSVPSSSSSSQSVGCDCALHDHDELVQGDEVGLVRGVLRGPLVVDVRKELFNKKEKKNKVKDKEKEKRVSNVMVCLKGCLLLQALTMLLLTYEV
jgi:hypothetical protein